MIITKAYAQKLIREGKARHGGYMLTDEGALSDYYAIIDRSDTCRTDHYHVSPNTREYSKTK